MLTGLHAERVLHFSKVAGHGGEVGVGVGQNKPPRENSVLQEQTLAEEGGRGRDKDACHNPEDRPRQRPEHVVSMSSWSPAAAAL